METIFFDVETGPLPESEIAAMMPPFDPAEVKTGNLKDPVKIAEKLREAEEAHRREFFDRAALDPLTGRVVAIGVLAWAHHPGPSPLTPLPSDGRGEPAGGDFVVIGDEDEGELLREFWARCRGELGRVHQLVGFNVCQFDLPFLFRRSWKHRVPVPFGYRRGRYWSDQVLDLRECWQLGDRQSRGSLGSIAQHLGVGEKNGDGAEFAKLWVTDRAKAVEYLRNDLDLTVRIAEALGVVECAAQAASDSQNF